MELWLVDKQDLDNEEYIYGISNAQILRFKFTNEIDFSSNRLLKELMCTKTRQMLSTHSVGQLKLAGLSEIVIKIMEQDQSIKLRLANISLE